MIIKSVHIDYFRALKDIDFDLGENLTAIVGHNGTMKTTLLGILGQTFTISKGHPMFGEKTIDNYGYKSQFKEKFKLPDTEHPGMHKWKLNLYPNIYKQDFFECHSIPRSKDDNRIRFWSTEGKGANTGYPQTPVHYISLKRVTPIGEETNFNMSESLEDEEKKFLIDEYNNIFLNFSTSLSIKTIVSSNKHTASIHSESHDALTISAGQDNFGKIMLSILSFRRLYNKYPSDYHGGIILIDEIESTFHPLAQEKLIKRLYKYSKDFKIQFIFTTHSPTVIKSAFFDKHSIKQAKLVYLKKVGDVVNIYRNDDIDSVVAELSGETVPEKKPPAKIQLFCEDNVGRLFIKSLLNDYSKQIKYVDCSIGAEEYFELLRVKLEPLSKSVVIFDGDKNNSTFLKKFSTRKVPLSNVVFLPGKDCPEKMFYTFLFSLEEDDVFWDNSLGKYNKQKCFKDFPSLLSGNNNVGEFKKWYEQQRTHWGRGNSKLFNYWKVSCPKEYEEFVQSFKTAFEWSAKINGIYLES